MHSGKKGGAYGPPITFSQIEISISIQMELSRMFTIPLTRKNLICPREMAYNTFPGLWGAVLTHAFLLFDL